MSLLKLLYAKVFAEYHIITAKQRFPDSERDRELEYFDLYVQYVKGSDDDTTVMYEHDIGQTTLATDWNSDRAKIPILRSD